MMTQELDGDGGRAGMVVTRFAPSPTGHLHIGGARTALFCWAFARRQGGRFLLRIEDTDQARSSEDSARGILEDLAWLGIGWDEGPVFTGEGGVAFGGDSRGVGPFEQSRRRVVYDEWFERLLSEGKAYPAFETPEELGAMRREAEAAKRTFVYRRRGDYDHDAAVARVRAGESHVLRLFVPEGRSVTVKDEVLGDVVVPYEEIDDLVIRKADGFPTYHFAVVVDDALMGVTHVLRGQEHLNNTPRHVLLQEAMGFGSPVYAHMPLIFNPDGSKMSKRDKDKAARAACKAKGVLSVSSLGGGVDGLVDEGAFSAWLGDTSRQLPTDALRAVGVAVGVELPEIDVEDFRRAGYLPEVVCNYVALLGWNPGMKNEDGTDLERFDLGFLAEHFGIERIGKTNSKFDRVKLLSFNAQTIQHGMTDEEFCARWRGWAGVYAADLVAAMERKAGVGSEERVQGLWLLAACAARPRSKTLAEAGLVVRFALVGDDEIEFDPKAMEKHVLKGDGAAVLREIGEMLSGLDGTAWDEPASLEAAVGSWCEGKGLGMGKAASPLRVALTGAGVSPGLGQTLALVGRDGVAARIGRCLSAADVK